jgi:hypothetical protein
MRPIGLTSYTSSVDGTHACDSAVVMDGNVVRRQNGSARVAPGKATAALNPQKIVNLRHAAGNQIVESLCPERTPERQTREEKAQEHPAESVS